MKRQRSYKEDGTLAHYVVYLLPEGRYWTSKVRGEYAQMHMTTRDGGRYIETDGAGRLRESPALFDQLNGTSPALFHKTLAYMRDNPRMAKLVRAIEVVQEHEAKRSEKTLAETALLHELSERTLRRHFWSGVELLGSLLVGENVPITDDYRKVS
ncbi:hypothetical protein D3C87_777480 [compost metagenome]